MAKAKEQVIMTPKALAEELSIDPKTLRTYLRKAHARTVDAKNTSWTLDEATVKSVREHYASKATKNDEVEVEA